MERDIRSTVIVKRGVVNFESSKRNYRRRYDEPRHRAAKQYSFPLLVVICNSKPARLVLSPP